MPAFLVDTNVISEGRKGARANPGVQAFWQSVDDGAFFIPVQAIGEIRQGVERVRHRGDLPQAQMLETWLENLIHEQSDRILGFDSDCAQVWGKLMARNPQHPVDKQIAAIALIHDLTVVTRNVNDFRDTSANLLNPFD